MIFKIITILAAIKGLIELIKNGYNELVVLHLILIVVLGILIELRKGRGLEWAQHFWDGYWEV